VADAPSGILYADTSALVKLVIREAETEVLSGEVASWERVATSEITAVELPRAVARARSGGRADVVDDRTVLELLAAIGTVPLTDDVRALAAGAKPVELRTLDAIHLASALALDDDLAAILTYDRRMQHAAELLDLTVLAPR
jgi:predicted nucleic acid-binding protein